MSENNNNILSSINEEKRRIWQQAFDSTRQQLIENEASKRKIILTLANQLEMSDMPLEYICSIMVNELHGYASKSYITEILPPKFKRPYELQQEAQAELSTSRTIDVNAILEDAVIRKDAEMVSKNMNIDTAIDKPLTADYHTFRNENQELRDKLKQVNEEVRFLKRQFNSSDIVVDTRVLGEIMTIVNQYNPTQLILKQEKGYAVSVRCKEGGE